MCPRWIVGVILLNLAVVSDASGVVSQFSAWGGNGLQQATAVARDSNGNTYIAGWTDAPDFPFVGNNFACGQSRNAFLIKLDPYWNVAFAVCLGGAGDTGATSAGLDAAGNIYVAGSTASDSLAGQKLSGRGANRDGFVIALDPSGQHVLYAVAVGGSGNDSINAMAVRADGAVFVAGYTSSPGLGTANAAQPSLRGPQNAFAAALDASGNITYCTYAGGSGVDAANAIALDSSGAVWIAGVTGSADFPLSSPFQSSLGGAQTAFVAKISAGGQQFLFSTYLGGSGGWPSSPEAANAIALDQAGNAYVAGVTSSFDFPVNNPYQAFYGGQSDCFLAGFSATGALLFSTYLGGQNWDSAYAVAILADGRIVVSGDTLSTNFPITADGEAWQSGGYLGFIAVLDASGQQLLFSSYIEEGFSYADLALSGTNPAVAVGVENATGQGGTTLAAAAQISIPAIGALGFVPITPCRAVDTRNPAAPLAGPSIAGGASRSFAIAGNACGIPSTAQALSLNAAIVPTSHGYLTLWPTGQPQPATASVNSPDGGVHSNGAIVPAGTGGAISAYALDAMDVVLDVNGYFVPATDSTVSALAFYPVTPCRMVDTRNANGDLGGPFLAGGSTRVFPLLEAADSCSISSAAQAYSLNIAVVPRTGVFHYLTAWADGQSQPGVATLNDPQDINHSNAAIVPAGSNGSIDIYATNDTDVVIDINGYFAPPGPAGLSFYTLPPCRALDTRNPPGSPPFTGTLAVDLVASGCGAPSTAQAYVFNATALPQNSHGYLTLWQQNAAQPAAVNLNDPNGATTGNMAIVPTNNGSINAYFPGTAWLVLDLFGYFAP